MIDGVLIALIVDDDHSARSILEKYLSTIDIIRVLHSVDNTSSALEVVERCEPDVIFLDINMPEEDGLQFANRLIQLGIQSQIVFTTAFRNYAVHAFNLKPLDYIVKPFGPDEVIAVVDKVYELVLEQQRDHIEVWGNKIHDKLKFRSRSGWFFVPREKIFYVRANEGFCDLVYIDGSSEEVYSLFSEIVEEFKNLNFVRITRSVLANLEYITRVDKKNRKCLIKTEFLEKEFSLTKRRLNLIEGLFTIKLC
jgi:DNA-binding LytR/AlgR family response regulator